MKYYLETKEKRSSLLIKVVKNVNYLMSSNTNDAISFETKIEAEQFLKENKIEKDFKVLEF
jgi:hypothetical protein